jgi:hypothetical protein
LLSNSESSADSRWYVWSYPGCPIRVHLGFEAIDQLREDILHSAPRDRETGGLLIGKKRLKTAAPITIVDFVPLPPAEDSSSSYFTVSPSQLAEVIERCPSDSEVVGYYRTALDRQVHLRQEDLDCIHASFRDPLDVFLVIAAKEGGRLSAGFFVWQTESLAYEPYLIFPFSTEELIAGKWPIRSGNKLGEGTLAAAMALFNQTNTLGKAAIVVALLAVVSAFFLTQTDTSASVSKTPTPARLGLRVDRDNADFLVAWDRSTPEIAGAKAGNLLISDGSGPPTFVALTPEQLRQGTLTYTARSLGDKVEFQLDVLESSGPERTESIISISGAPGLADESASPVALPRSSRAAAKLDVPDVSSKKPRPVVQRKIFVAPKRKAPLAAVNAMPEPPAIAPDVPAPAPDSLVFNNLANSQARRSVPAGPVQQEPASGVTITSEPSGAKVEINGILAGYTPLTIKVTPLGLGFTVTVTKDGFAKWMAQTFSTAEPSGLHAQLRELPKQR